MTTSRSGRVPSTAPISTALRSSRRPRTVPPTAAPRAAWVIESIGRRSSQRVPGYDATGGGGGGGGVPLGIYPAWPGGEDVRLHRAVVAVGAGQVAGAHQELPGDLRPGEAEGAPEEPDPLRMGQRVVVVEPGGEAAVLIAQGLEDAGVVDHRLDLEAVADDAGVRQQPGALGLAVGGHPVDGEALEGLPEGGAFLEHGEPGEPRLVDLQGQALEEGVIVAHREAVLVVVVGAVKRMTRGQVTIVAHAGVPVAS